MMNRLLLGIQRASRRGLTARALMCLGITCSLVACQRGEPPTSNAGKSATSSSTTAPSPALLDAAASRVADASSLDASLLAPAAPLDAGPSVAASLLAGVDAGSMPQTRDQPAASGPAFDARVRAFWEGIVADDPSRALDFFFPVAAYAQVKDVANPQADWRRRLVANFERDVHALHATLGSDPELVALEVPDRRARWVEPGEEYNKLGYYRVYGTTLRWTSRTAGDARRKHEAPVSSLISWRGEWYVVHLSGFK